MQLRSQFSTKKVLAVLPAVALVVSGAAAWAGSAADDPNPTVPSARPRDAGAPGPAVTPALPGLPARVPCRRARRSGPADRRPGPGPAGPAGRPRRARPADAGATSPGPVPAVPGAPALPIDGPVPGLPDLPAAPGVPGCRCRPCPTWGRSRPCPACRRRACRRARRPGPADRRPSRACRPCPAHRRSPACRSGVPAFPGAPARRSALTRASGKLSFQSNQPGGSGPGDRGAGARRHPRTPGRTPRTG